MQVLAIIGGLLLVRYVNQPGRSLVTLVQDALAVLGPLNLTDAQARQVANIRSGFEDAGLGWLADAAVANAWAESKLDPNAVGDNGHAVGLFQLNSARASAAGFGMTTEERKLPTVNIARIIDVAQDEGAEGMRGRPNAELVIWFAHRVERCAACGHNEGTGELEARVTHFGRLFGAHRLLEVP